MAEYPFRIVIILILAIVALIIFLVWFFGGYSKINFSLLNIGNNGSYQTKIASSKLQCYKINIRSVLENQFGDSLYNYSCNDIVVVGSDVCWECEVGTGISPSVIVQTYYINCQTGSVSSTC